jgi:DNA-binding transcriptional LysR family regulator
VLLMTTSPDFAGALGSLRVEEIYSFVVLCEELHYTNAAHRLYLSGGTLSRRINHLERALGGQLLRRTTHSVGLTPFGREFLHTARRLLDELTAVSARSLDEVFEPA